MKINATHTHESQPRVSFISPLLFNIYINDLITSLTPITYDVLAYADDLAMICQNNEDLLKAMEALQTWSMKIEL